MWVICVCIKNTDTICVCVNVSYESMWKSCMSQCQSRSQVHWHKLTTLMSQTIIQYMTCDMWYIWIIQIIGCVSVPTTSFPSTTISTVGIQTGQVVRKVLGILQMRLQPSSGHFVVGRSLLETKTRAALNATRGASLEHVLGTRLDHHRVWCGHKTLGTPFAAWLCLCFLGWHDERSKKRRYQTWIGTETGETQVVWKELKCWDCKPNQEFFHVIQSWLFNGHIMRQCIGKKMSG